MVFCTLRLYRTCHNNRDSKSKGNQKRVCNLYAGDYAHAGQDIQRTNVEEIPCRLNNGKVCCVLTIHITIVSRGGWFGSSVVFQDDAMVMLLYWRKCLLLVGEIKFYMDTWRRRTHNTWRWRTTLIKFERCYWMTASLYRKYNTFSDRESKQQQQQ